jgi:hypothetical protein
MIRTTFIAACIIAAGCGANKNPGWDGTTDTGTEGWPDMTGHDVPDMATDIEEELCGGSSFDISRVIPDVMIVLDRSNSMADSPPAPPLWETIRTAITTVTAAPRDTEIWFGLMSFPGPACAGLSNQCIHPGPTEVLVPVGEGAGASIASTLGGLATCGGTPIALSLQSAGAYLDTLADDHPKYVLLATDGGPNCNAALDGGTCICTNPLGGCAINNENCLDHERTYDVLDALCGRGIETFVLGMGGAADWDWVMAAMAAHGCTGDAYAADDLTGITDVLNAIAGEVATCQFELPCAEIPDLNKVNFFYEPGHTPIPRDTTHASGWDWVDPCEAGDVTGVVEFYGVDCDNILTGAVESISAEFGCPTILI